MSHGCYMCSTMSLHSRCATTVAAALLPSERLAGSTALARSRPAQRAGRCPAARILRTKRSRLKSPWVYPGRNGGPATYQSVRDAFEAAKDGDRGMKLPT